MLYGRTIRTNRPETVTAQPGQWIDYNGARGRFMGRVNGVSWIAWGATAAKRFPAFAAAFRANHPVSRVTRGLSKPRVTL